MEITNTPKFQEGSIVIYENEKQSGLVGTVKGLSIFPSDIVYVIENHVTKSLEYVSETYMMTHAEYMEGFTADVSKLDISNEPINENDMVNTPKHYLGLEGLEVEDVLMNFIPKYDDGYVAHRVSSAIEYLLRAPEKNGIEDIKKAKKNLEQALRHIQKSIDK